MNSDRYRESRLALGHGLLTAGLLLQAAIMIKALPADRVDPQTARRLAGILMGGVVFVYANRAAKALTPLPQMTCDPIAEQAIRRFAAWTLALGGLGYGAAWMLAPYEIAGRLSVGVLAASVLLVLVRLSGWLQSRLTGLAGISPESLRRMMEREPVTVIDVNSVESFSQAHVPGALNLDPLYREDALPNDKEATLVFYCSNSLCQKGPNAARRAKELGYGNVRVMRAGIKGWVAARLETEGD